MTGARLNSWEAINQYAFAGNARLTIVSKRTQERRTFRLRESKDGRVFFVSVLTGNDNESDYEYLGTMRDGLYSHGRKSRIGKDAPANKAFEWFMRMNYANDARFFEQAECWHEGRCGRCGRALTVPESIATGLGPECSQRMGRANDQGTLHEVWSRNMGPDGDSL